MDNSKGNVLLDNSYIPIILAHSGHEKYARRWLYSLGAFFSPYLFFVKQRRRRGGEGLKQRTVAYKRTERHIFWVRYTWTDKIAFRSIIQRFTAAQLLDLPFSSVCRSNASSSKTSTLFRVTDIILTLFISFFISGKINNEL